jgi:hypothetical protein
MEKYPDGLALEQRFNAEVSEFVKCRTGVDGYNIEAAILLRDAGKMAALKMLQQDVIQVVGQVDLEEDTVESLIFKVV